MTLDYLNPFLLFPFLLVFTILYYLIPQKARWIPLLVASYAFLYGVGSWSVIILLINTVINYLLGRSLGNPQASRKKYLLVSGVLVNIVILFLFKYFSDTLNLNAVLGSLLSSTETSIIIPVGLSFYTLQSISYLVDVYKGLIPAEKHFGIFAVYQAFFPKIISGPIERGKKLIPQLRQPPKFEADNVLAGSGQILVGLFKKLVIADHLVLFVDEVFRQPGNYQGLTILIGLVFLGFQLYMDFSGYTDIALGVARVLGINLTQNFRRPYLSENLVEFWNRWHISLSTWLRDYIFYPLRRFLLQHSSSAANLVPLVIPPVVTMLVSGIWHGTGLNYLVWGLYHALFYTLVVFKRSKWGGQAQKSNLLVRIFKILVNFGVLTIGWLIFRSESLAAAFIMFKNIFVKSTTLEMIFRQTFYIDYLISIISILLVIGIEIILEGRKEEFRLEKAPVWLRWVVYFLIILCITVFGVFQKGGNPFIYGQF